jgi:MOSC domain-containing protein
VPWGNATVTAFGIRDRQEQEATQRAGKLVGTVSELWRYPVKSMLGEQRQSLLITERGIVGDRAWALRDRATGRIASAKKHPRLLEFQAAYDVEPTVETPGRIRIEAPDGRSFSPEDDGASSLVSEIVGYEVRFDNRPGDDEKTTIDRETVFGDVPVSSLKPDWTPERMPDYFQLASGSFLEIGAVYLLTSGSVDYLRALRGKDGVVDRLRFRPNIYIESTASGSGFIEDSWLGSSLAIGDEVACRDFERTLWCVTSTLAQKSIPRDLGILRTLAEHHEGCLGVYATVSSPGVVRTGDKVVLLDPAAA